MRLADRRRDLRFKGETLGGVCSVPNGRRRYVLRVIRQRTLGGSTVSHLTLHDIPLLSQSIHIPLLSQSIHIPTNSPTMSNDDKTVEPQALKRRRTTVSDLQTMDQPTAKRVRGSQGARESMDEDDDVGANAIHASNSQSGDITTRTQSYFTRPAFQSQHPREAMSQVSNARPMNKFSTGTVHSGQEKGKANEDPRPNALGRKTSTVLSRMMKTYQDDLSQYSGRNQLADQNSDEEEYNPPRLAHGDSVQLGQCKPPFHYRGFDF